MPAPIRSDRMSQEFKSNNTSESKAQAANSSESQSAQLNEENSTTISDQTSQKNQNGSFKIFKQMYLKEKAEKDAKYERLEQEEAQTREKL